MHAPSLVLPSYQQSDLCLQSTYPLEGAAPAVPQPSSCLGLMDLSKAIGAITNLCHLPKKDYVTLNNRTAEIDVKEETAVASGLWPTGRASQTYLHLAIITASSWDLASRLGGQLGRVPISARTVVKDIHSHCPGPWGSCSSSDSMVLVSVE